MEWGGVWDVINSNFGAGILGGLVVLLGILLERGLGKRADQLRERQRAAALLAQEVFMLRDVVLSKAGAHGGFDLWRLRNQVTYACFFYALEEVKEVEALVERARKLREWLETEVVAATGLRGTLLGDELAEEAELKGLAARRIFGRHAEMVIGLLHEGLSESSRNAFSAPTYPNLESLGREAELDEPTRD